MALFSRDATDFRPGEVIADRYKITGILGRGGFGAVYAGEHTGTEQAIAIKMLASDSGAAGEAAERFYREAKITAQLTHPNTVRVFDVGTVENGPMYLVMEMLRGPTLEQILSSLQKKNLGMSETQAIALMLPVLSSLAEAHAAGLVHRDLKPANLMLHDVAGSEPVVKVLDFGCSHTQDSELTAQGSVLGTPGYMSPEQCRGDDVGPGSDIYSIAVILYRCVTGSLPFDTNQPLQLIYKHAHEPVPDPRAKAVDRHVSDAMASVLLKGLAKKANERFPSAREMGRALERIRTQVNNAPVNLGGQSRTHIAGSPSDTGRQLVSLMQLAVEGYAAPEIAASDQVMAHLEARTEAYNKPVSESEQRRRQNDAALSAQTFGNPAQVNSGAKTMMGVAQSDGTAESAPSLDGPATVMREAAQPWHQGDDLEAPTDQTLQSVAPVAPASSSNTKWLVAVVLIAVLGGVGFLLRASDDATDEASEKPGNSAEKQQAPNDTPANAVAKPPSEEELKRQSELRMASRHVDLARATTDLDARVRHLIAAVKLAPGDKKYAAELKAAQGLAAMQAKLAKQASAARKAPRKARRHRPRPAPTAAPAPPPPPAPPRGNRIPAAILEE